MSSLNLAHIALYIAPADPYAPYFQEVLAESGIFHSTVDASIFESLNTIDVLVLGGYGKLDPFHAEALADWVRAGGVLIAAGSTWGQPGLFGLRYDNAAPHPSLAKLLAPEEATHLWPEKATDAIFMGGDSMQSMNAPAVCKTSLGTVGVSCRKSEQGHAYYFCPHLGQTMAQMQLGSAVECDRVAPTSSDYRFDDHHFRAEDGSVLDLCADRVKVDDSAPAVFLQPHADVIREIFTRIIVDGAHRIGKRVACFWHWPNNASGTAMLTIESEEFAPEHTQLLQRMLQLVGANATWLVATPGYSMDVYRQFHNWEHDVGLLFHVEEGASWHDEKLKIQHVTLSRSATMMPIVAARPAGGGWRRLTEFYDIAEGTGVKLSLSKGGRQPGTSGYLFGTCRPFYPCKRDGTFYQTMEIPYAAFLPGLITPTEVINALAEQAALRNGCFQIATNSVFIPNAVAADGVRRAVSIAKQNGLEFITGTRYAEFDKLRRNMRKKVKSEDAALSLSLIPEARIEGLTVLLSGTDWEVVADGRRLPVKTCNRFGCLFGAVVMNLDGKHQTEVQIKLEDLESRAA